jgi:hypothetical protein
MACGMVVSAPSLEYVSDLISVIGSPDVTPGVFETPLGSVGFARADFA